MAQEIGVAYVTLLPSGKGFSQAVGGQVDQAVASAERKGGGLFSRLGAVAKGVVAATAGAVTALGAIALGGGISRVLNIEDAQAKLRGLGNDTQAVEAIMKDALASVKGTAFGLDTAATVAASAVAAGIKPGQELERYLKLTADAATIAGVSMGEMGSIFNKVQTNTVAYTDDLQQLADRGIPIFQWLQDEYGVTAAELRKMVERGEVDAATFRKVIEENIGGAALESGKTTRGAFSNMMAALSRFGAALAGPFLGAARDFFNEMILVFDGITERLRPAFESLQWYIDGLDFDFSDRVLAGLDPLLNFINGFATALQAGTIDDWIAGITESLPGASLLVSIFEALESIAPTVQDFISELGTAIFELAPAFGELLEGLTPLIPMLGDLLIEVLRMLVDLLPSLVPLLESLITLIVNWGSSAEFAALLDGLGEFVNFLTDLTMRASEFFSAVGLLSSFLRGDTSLAQYRQGFLALPGPMGDTARSIFAVIGRVFELRDAVYQKVGEVVGFFQSLPGRINAALAGAGNWLYSVGRDIIAGLISGVQSMIGSAVAAVKNVGGAMLDGVKSFLGIHSPSRVFRDQVGQMIPLGLVEGIDLRRHEAFEAITNLVPIPKLSPSAAGGPVINNNISMSPIRDNDPLTTATVMGREIARRAAG